MASKKILLRDEAGKDRREKRVKSKERMEIMAEADSEENESINVEIKSRSQNIEDDTSTNATERTAAKLNAVIK